MTKAGIYLSDETYSGLISQQKYAVDSLKDILEIIETQYSTGYDEGAVTFRVLHNMIKRVLEKLNG